MPLWTGGRPYREQMHRGAALAAAISAAHGLPSAPLVRVDQRGSVNHVFIVGSSAGRCVVRFARDPLCGDDFAAEQWCASTVRAHGIPTPEVIAHGVRDGVPYGIQRYVDGASIPTTRPTDDRGRPGTTASGAHHWSLLGRLCRLINEIQPDDTAPDGLFSRFGRDLDEAWRLHLGYNVAALDVDDPLLRKTSSPAPSSAVCE